MSRLFFALCPDPQTRNKLAAVCSNTGLSTGNPVLPANLHMTIAFLGGVEIVRLEQLNTATANICMHAFSLVIDRSGWWEQARVFWAAPAQVPDALLALHGSIARMIGDCGMTVESRAYLPHITLARNVNSPVSIEFEPIQWDARDLCLVESIPHLGYAEYKIIQRWALT